MARKQFFELVMNNILRNFILHEKHYSKLKILHQLFSNFWATFKTLLSNPQLSEQFWVLFFKIGASCGQLF